jgi:hypothetical protein
MPETVFAQSLELGNEGLEKTFKSEYVIINLKKYFTILKN